MIHWKIFFVSAFFLSCSNRPFGESPASSEEINGQETMGALLGDGKRATEGDYLLHVDSAWIEDFEENYEFFEYFYGLDSIGFRTIDSEVLRLDDSLTYDFIVQKVWAAGSDSVRLNPMDSGNTDERTGPSDFRRFSLQSDSIAFMVTDLNGWVENDGGSEHRYCSIHDLGLAFPVNDT